MAFDITKPVTENTLTPEEKTWLATHEANVSRAAAEKAVKDAEDARKAALPATYELKPTDGSPLDPKEDLARIAAYAKMHGLSIEAAQALLKEVEMVAATALTRRAATSEGDLKARTAKWSEEVKLDKDLGGANFPATEAHLLRFRNRFAPEGSPLRAILEETGYGSHPEIVRVFSAIGKAMGEDSTVLRALGGGGKEPIPIEKRMFPTFK